VDGRNEFPVNSPKRLFSAAPEGTVAVFFIDSLPPGGSFLDR
jgi:hypothetical protein